MDELTHAIYNSFDNNQNPPNILDLDRSFLEYWEIREFLSKLSKNKWQDIVELDLFFQFLKTQKFGQVTCHLNGSLIIFQLFF